jgi:hypothetical protein
MIVMEVKTNLFYFFKIYIKLLIIFFFKGLVD